MIGIIDYGMGNLRSVQKAFERLGVEAVLGHSPTELAGVEKLILPGVGAFRDAIHDLKSKGWEQLIRDHVAANRPMLGICLGMQLLFDVSYEDGEFEGLGLVSGEVRRFQAEPQLKIPHMGWNALEIVHDNPLLSGISNGDYVYFVHSYHVVPQDEAVVATRTMHGTQSFVSIIAQGNLFATQFHPEKSQRVGLKLLENFASLPVI
ncbi:MAG: imidazole glycerol phosphate synthase subunit HisH [Planctomycetaceae bacterium]|nr:imidazole glycerol phosphate synthase subunit HisH [Planctomycetaceae bacterium]MCB9950888.1 imidazole glycerol phosphate synthase subunit HisH [Planctomycetaceae bacterium]